jgi:hypothetical protein
MTLDFVNRLSNYFYEKVNPKNVLFLAISYVFFGTYLLPLKSKDIVQNTSQSLLDVRFGYSKTQVNQFFSEIGQLGRENHIFFTSVLDSLYPVFYGLFLIFFISYLYQKAFSKNYEFRYLNLVPIIIIIADFAENVLILYMLNVFPHFSENVVKWSSNATLIKWGAVLFSILLVFIGVFAWAFKSLLKAKV